MRNSKHRIAVKRPHRRIRKERKINNQFRQSFRTTRGRCTQCNALILLTRLIYKKKNHYQQPATICDCGAKNYVQ